jgi:AraC-like DNA-binding protein
VALACNVSPRTLMRLFAAEGTTPIRWLWHQRLAAACRALAGGRGARVTEVALSCGFSDLSHFSRAFKAEFGRSPREIAAGAAPGPRLLR